MGFPVAYECTGGCGALFESGPDNKCSQCRWRDGGYDDRARMRAEGYAAGQQAMKDEAIAAVELWLASTGQSGHPAGALRAIEAIPVRKEGV